MEVDEGIARAIRQAVQAGACWTAIAVGHRPDAPWKYVGQARSRRASEELAGVVKRLGVAAPGPSGFR